MCDDNDSGMGINYNARKKIKNERQSNCIAANWGVQQAMEINVSTIKLIASDNMISGNAYNNLKRCIAQAG